MLSNATVISGLHVNLFRVTRVLQKGFQVTSEGEALILKKIQLRSVLTIKGEQIWQRISTDHQVLPNRKRCLSFVSQEAGSIRKAAVHM